MLSGVCRMETGIDMKTTFLNPPIPIRCFDWTCVADDYEPGDPQGFGATEEDAINDYLEQMKNE